MSFLGEIKRRKVFQVAAVYLVVSWLIMQVVDVVNEPLNLPDWFDTAVIVALAIGLPIALILAWAFDVTPDGVVKDQGIAQGSGRRIEYVLIGLLAVAVAWIFYRVEFDTSEPVADSSVPAEPAAENVSAETRQDVLPNSVAVLPFNDFSPDQSHRYFADGMQEELLGRLAKLKGLEVSSRTSVEHYRSTNLSLPAIAERIGVDSVIEGSVRIAGDRVRITVQLIDAETDRHLWAENFDRELSVQNIFLIQEEVAGKIAEALKLKYRSDPARGWSQLPTASLDAYNAYLLGRYHTFRQTPDDLELAVSYLEQATGLDPAFAEAHASLGWAYSFLGTSYGGRPPREVYPQAKQAGMRAMSLDSELADARTLYADILTWFDWDFEAAEREYLKTVELNPNNVLGYALFLTTQLRHDEAIALIERRLAASPNDPYVHINAAWRFLSARQYTRAIEEANLAQGHVDANSVIGFAYLATGETQRAVAVFEQDLHERDRKPQQLSNLAVAYRINNRAAEAEELLAELQLARTTKFLSPALVAAVYFAADDPDNGFAMLQEAIDVRAREVIFLQVDHLLDGYRDDPRYQELTRTIGFR